MIVAIAAVLADLCGPVAADQTPDPAAAAAYAQVGDDARARGDLRVAAVAYRKAIAADAAAPGARTALDALCSADRAPPPMSDDDMLAAGIARYRGGDLDGAAALLAPIADHASTAAAGAHFFLGLIALARHAGGQAARDLAIAAREPAYAELAARMTRIARRDGRVAVSLLVEPELDTNAQLLPDTPPAGATTGPPVVDEDTLYVGAFTVRPQPWLALRDTMVFRDQRTLDALDFWGNDAAVVLELDHAADHALVSYDLDYDLLAGAPYLIAHRGGVEYHHDLGRVSLVAGYALRRRDYEQASETSFTGWVHQASAGALVHLGERADVEARALFRRELTEDPTFADVAGGAQLIARARPASRLRAVVTATTWWAAYDQAEPDGSVRRDMQIELAVDGELDLSDRVLAVVGADMIRDNSTIADFQYGKVVVRAGLSIAFGGP